MKSKQEILDMFLPVLQGTREYSTLVSLEWDERQQVVFAQFRHGIKVIHCEADSSAGMIRDIMRQI